MRISHKRGDIVEATAVDASSWFMVLTIFTFRLADTGIQLSHLPFVFYPKCYWGSQHTGCLCEFFSWKCLFLSEFFWVILFLRILKNPTESDFCLDMPVPWSRIIFISFSGAENESNENNNIFMILFVCFQEMADLELLFKKVFEDGHWAASFHQAIIWPDNDNPLLFQN